MINGKKSGDLKTCQAGRAHIQVTDQMEGNLGRVVEIIMLSTNSVDEPVDLTYRERLVQVWTDDKAALSQKEL